MGENAFHYSAEYSKSSRSSCRFCKTSIGKGSLRLAVLFQSPTFDGKIPHWYHFGCFFLKQKPKSIKDIAHFDSLRWDDQKQIKEKFYALGNGGTSRTNMAQKYLGSEKIYHFFIEYAKSARTVCKGCGKKILKGEIRISALDFESEKAKKTFPIPYFRHADCFIGLRRELQYYGDGADLPGFNKLSAKDKIIIKEKIKPIKRESEDETDSSSISKKSRKEELIIKQNTQIFSYRDNLEENLKKSELALLLKYNDYDPISGNSEMLDTLADLMTFGNIGRCNACKTGNLIFRSGVGYFCNGNISEWAKCTNIVEKPVRIEFKIPEELKKAYPFLKKYKYKKNGDREIVVSQTQSGNSTQGIKRKEIENFENIESLVFAIVGIKNNKRIKENIESLGGKISLTIDSSTAAVFTRKNLVEKEIENLQAAKAFGVDCIPEDFFDTPEPSDILMRIKAKNMAPWVKEDVASRLSKLKKLKTSHSELTNKRFNLIPPIHLWDFQFFNDLDRVDIVTSLRDFCHVYKQKEKLYSVVLGSVDISKGSNSYYKIQLLENNTKTMWYLFRRWGRVGTNIGSTHVLRSSDLQDALAQFNELYEAKTGNKFSSKNPKKLPGYYFPMKIDYIEKNNLNVNTPNTPESKLPLAIQDLISLIFDETKMEYTMLEHELDLEKMPLGKLNRKQIEDSFNILSEAMEWTEKLNKKEEREKTKARSSANVEIVTIKNHILDCSNRFYTLIPHNFGFKSPPLLDNEEYIKNKIDMVSSLNEIEIAYNLLKSESMEPKSMHPLDEAYIKLKTDIEVLEKSSDEFKMIHKYFKNTQVFSRFSYYSCDLLQVFKINRHGEEKQFSSFKKLHNRQLLWHGSRLTNFVGILSEGLRTDFSLGNGIYFADMFSKSAGYCHTSVDNPIGLLLLCEVALGEMLELKGGCITKLPSGKHSTKVLGGISPDPAEMMKLDDGLLVPLGIQKPTDVKDAGLFQNEYIVYNSSQIKIKYILQASFRYIINQ